MNNWIKVDKDKPFAPPTKQPDMGEFSDGHQYQASDSVDNEVLRAFKAGAKAEREKVLKEAVANVKAIFTDLASAESIDPQLIINAIEDLQKLKGEE